MEPVPTITLTNGVDLDTSATFQKTQDGSLRLVAREGETRVEVWLDLDEVLGAIKELKRRKV